MVEKEAIRSRRRKRFLLQDEQRERAAVALISVAWRCHVRGRSRRQTSAAITVQRIFRGRLARRSLLERLAARTIQFHTRRFLRRLAKIRAELLTVATLRLQRAFLNRQRARCRKLQAVAHDAAAEAIRRRTDQETARWVADQQRRRQLEKKESEVVSAALKQEREDAAALRAYGGKDCGKAELEELKQKLQREEAAVNLIRRVFLRRMMRRRVRVMVHEARQEKMSELASDVSSFIESALDGRVVGSKSRSGRASSTRQHDEFARALRSRPSSGAPFGVDLLPKERRRGLRSAPAAVSRRGPAEHGSRTRKQRRGAASARRVRSDYSSSPYSSTRPADPHGAAAGWVS